MVTVPVSTVEKPLTAIDYIAKLSECYSRAEVVSYAERCPAHVKKDERFTKAIAGRLAELVNQRRRA